MKSARNSNFELVRIFAIIGVIMGHYSVWGALPIRENVFTFQEVFLDLMTIGNLSVTIFMMISGYFLIKSTKVNWEKFVAIILVAMFYSLFIFTIMCIDTKTFDWMELYNSFFSFLTGRAWFITCYLIIYLFHPFINKLIKALSDRELNIFVLLLFIVSTVITILPYTDKFLNGLVSLFVIYVYGAFLQLRKEHKLFSKKNGWILVGIGLFVIITSVVLLKWVAQSNPAMGEGGNLYFYTKNAFPVIAVAIGVIMICEKSKPHYSRVVNFIASFNLGIYLAHSNTEYWESVIWGRIFRVPYYIQTYHVVPALFITCIVLYLCALTLEMTRHYVLGVPIHIIYEKIKSKYQQKKELQEVEA